ncbi:hypothetical protein JHK82_034028 [Glycine max]|nr:hypothetical protein JHK85_034736 [Glycine max]KAG5119608.1 hypothetical protein JHK82_034028 [Glycine max]KAH1221793.1 Uridine kinase-like protein 2, chloroplastic [Glycine max]
MMLKETTSIDYVMEAASRPHFSTLRLDGRVLSSATVASSTLDSSLTLNSLPNQPIIIRVSGGTALDKTTVCDMIIQQLHDHCVVLVNQDLFYRGLNPEELECAHEYNFDHPDAFDSKQLLECTRKLISGQGVHVPIYDFKNHQGSSDNFR